MHPLRLARLLPIWALLLWAPCLAAQQAGGLDPRKAITQYVHDVWQTENGLPQNSVLDVLQTRDGYLWLGTRGGLARFDGVRFTVFSKENTPALGDNDIRALLEDREGSLWIGTYSGGLTRLKNGSFTRYTTGEGLAHDQVRSLFEDREGSLWIGTYGGGISRLKDGKFTTYTTRDGLADDKVRPILQDREGSLWIGTYGGGISRLKDGKFTTYTTRDGLADDRVNTLYQDRGGSLWIGTYGSGVSRLTDEGFTTFSTRDGLSDGMVMGIYEDREGSLWIGTNGGGLNRLKDGTFTTYGTKEGLSNNIVYSVYEDPDATIWIGTEGGGLNRLKNGELTAAYTTREGLSSNNVVAVYRDREGSLWIGTFGGGLNRLRNGNLTAFHVKDGLSSEMVFALYEDREGSLWIGTSDVLNRFKDGKLTTYGGAEGLTGTGVRAIHQDRSGALWVGTSGGLNRLKDGKFTSYTTEHGLAGNAVLAIYEDGEGTLWIGSRAGGLSRLKDGKFTAFSTNDGLPDDVILSILEDASGNLWMSSSRGIFRVSRHALNAFAAGRARALGAVLYGKGDGIRGGEGNGGSQPVAWKTTDGRLWFSTPKGAAVVDPAHLETNQRVPPVILEQVVVNGRSLSPTTGEVILPPGSRSMEFHYTALSFLAPEKVRFRYRLEGFDQGWVDAGTRRVAYYTNVPPGQYVFRVLASNDDGVWNRVGAAFGFRLQSYFYQTYWFYALVGLAVVLLAVAIFRLKTQRLKARERELARLVDERTEELRHSQQQLLVSEKMAALGRLTAGIAHEINSPLGGVLNSLQLARVYIDEYSASLDDPEVTTVDHRAIADDLASSITLAETGTRKVAQFVRSIKTQTRSDGEGQRDFDPAQELEPILALMRHELADRKIVLHAESHAGLHLTGDPAKFDLVARNLISNAVDAYEGAEGEVWLRLTGNGNSPGGVRLEVEDRGSGIPEEIRSRIFDYLFTTKDIGSGTGLGLSIVHSIVTSEFDGQISVQSEVGHGTTVSVWFPSPATAAQTPLPPGASDTSAG